MKSPLEDLIPTPEFLQPFIDFIYWPTDALAKILSRPEGTISCIFLIFNIDQLMYLVSFAIAILSGWTLNAIKDEGLRKSISIVMGCMIQMYMYGKGKLIQ